MTESALVDKIKDSWAKYKDSRHKIAGDYYYDEFIQGVINNQIIKIRINHFDVYLQKHLGEFSTSYMKRLINRCIYEVISSIKGGGFAYMAKKENRIRWCFTCP